MKTKLLSLSLLLFSSLSAHATLIDRGNGLIYDNVLDVTWLQDANYANTTAYVTSASRDVTTTNGKMSWEESVEWAGQLNYAGYSGWRLPDVKPINGSFFQTSVTYTGTTDFGERITSPQTELSYMYFVNLNNTSVHNTSGFLVGCGPVPSSSCLTNTGPFNNLQPYNYWSGTEIDSVFAWSFNSQHGIQTLFDGKANQFYSWAVHDGDIAAVPLPTAFWLFGSALLGLIRHKYQQTRH